MDTPSPPGLHREGSAPQFRYAFGDAQFDESKDQLLRDGQAVALEPRPRQLLLELLRRANEVVTKEELFASVWEGRVTVDNVLANAINKLRSALGDSGATRVVTLPRVGYRLVGPVERVVVGQLAVQDFALQAGQAINGRPGFRLETPLGARGRRHVWLARHAKLGQARVFKFAADADGLRALKREFTLFRVLKAGLGDHPGFAQVLDANFAEAPYWLECDYAGPDLLTWATGPDLPLQALSPDQRLALFIDIAAAVAAAHSVGVLHKDIKPANVLMSRAPGQLKPLLTDFGSGHATDPHRLHDLGLTAMGLTVSQVAQADGQSGTPLYLAPEVQAGQSSTVQSDVYALGLMLYQILVGDLRRPLSTGWQRDVEDELLREDITAATEGEPMRRTQSVPRLLEGLSTLKARRLAAAQQMKNTEQRRQMEALVARRRARRPWLWSAFATLVLGLLASGWLYLRADTARLQAQAESTRAQAVYDFMRKDVIQSADVVRVGQDKMPTMMEVLVHAQTRVGDRFQGLPRTEAAVRRQLGMAFLHALSARNAAAEFKGAIALLESIVPSDDEELLMCRFGLARAMLSLTIEFTPKQAEAVLIAAERDASQALMGPTSELTILAIQARLEWLGQQQQFTEAVPLAKQLVQATDTWGKTDIAARFDARLRLAEVLAALGDAKSAQAVIDEISAPPFGAPLVGVVTFARARIAKAKLQFASGNLPEAKAGLIRAIEDLTLALGPRALHVGQANYELANIHGNEGDMVSATNRLQLALRAFTSALGEEHGHTVSIRVNLAIHDILAGRSAEGLATVETLLLWFLARGHETHALHFYQGYGLNDLRKFKEAMAALEKVDPERLAWLHNGESAMQSKLKAEQARAMVGTGRRNEGIALMRQAIAEMEVAATSRQTIDHYRAMVKTL